MDEQAQFGWPTWQTVLLVAVCLPLTGLALADGELVHAVIVLNGLLVIPELYGRGGAFRRLTVSPKGLEYVTLFGMKRQRFQFAELDRVSFVDMGSMWRQAVLEFRGKERIAFGSFFGFGTQRVGEKVAVIEQLRSSVSRDTRPAV